MTFEIGMQTLKEIFKGIDDTDIFVFLFLMILWNQIG